MSTKGKLEKIIEHYGKNAQIIKAMEEFGELITELAKELNGQGSFEHISEEMADAFVMLKQLQLIFDIDGEDLEAICKSKIVRTMNRIKVAELFEIPKEDHHETDQD